MKPLKKLEELGISPAPWKIGDMHIKDAENISCASCVTKPEAPMNRLLVAAAPDMYSALWDLLFGKTGYCNVCRGHELGNCKECDYGKAMAALEKAGGAK